MVYQLPSPARIMHQFKYDSHDTDRKQMAINSVTQTLNSLVIQ